MPRCRLELPPERYRAASCGLPPGLLGAELQSRRSELHACRGHKAPTYRLPGGPNRGWTQTANTSSMCSLVVVAVMRVSLQAIKGVLLQVGHGFSLPRLLKRGDRPFVAQFAASLVSATLSAPPDKATAIALPLETCDAAKPLAKEASKVSASTAAI